MKLLRVLGVLFAIFFLAVPTITMAAQEVPSGLQIDHFKLSSGKGPLSSGIVLTVDLAELQGPRELTLIFDASQGYGLYRFKKIGGQTTNLEVLATGGIFLQTPWLAPMFKANYTPWLSSTHWVGWTAGAVEHAYWGTKFMFSWQELTLDFPHWSAYYAALNYQEGSNRQDIIGVTAKVQLNSKFQLRVGWDRDTSNAGWCVRPERDMFTFGVKYNPRG